MVPIICFYDNTLYTDDTIVTVSETEADKCKESYFYNIDKIKVVNFKCYIYFMNF